MSLPANIFDPAQPGGVPKMVDRISTYWGQDRAALGECGGRNRVLVAAVDAHEGRGRTINGFQ